MAGGSGHAQAGWQGPAPRRAAVPLIGTCLTDKARGTRGQGGTGHSSAHDSQKPGPPRRPSRRDCPCGAAAPWTATQRPPAARCRSRPVRKASVTREPQLAEQSPGAWPRKGRGLCDPHPRTRLLVAHEAPHWSQLPMGPADLIWNPVPSSAVAGGRSAHP